MVLMLDTDQMNSFLQPLNIRNECQEGERRMLAFAFVDWVYAGES